MGCARGIRSSSHLGRLSASSFTHTDGVTNELGCGAMIKLSKLITREAVCVCEYIIDRYKRHNACIAELIHRDVLAHGIVQSVGGQICARVCRGKSK